MIEDEIIFEEGDHSIPEGLLELHVELEDAGVTPEEFKEVFGNDVEASDESAVGGESS